MNKLYTNATAWRFRSRATDDVDFDPWCEVRGSHNINACMSSCASSPELYQLQYRNKSQRSLIWTDYVPQKWHEPAGGPLVASGDWQGRIRGGSWQPVAVDAIPVWTAAMAHSPQDFKLRRVGEPLSAELVIEALEEAGLIIAPDPGGESEINPKLHRFIELLGLPQ